jgi:cyclopropane-fatty-acyl-phospholipid synthase
VGRHYGFTVARWLERFRANGGSLDFVKYDARFRRMWEYYLSCGIAAAAVADSAVYQILFTNDATLELPLARV